MEKDSNIPKQFGQKLRTLRNRYKLTQIELAEILGYLSHGYLSDIEKGKKIPTVELVLSVSRLFQVSTDQLLKDELDLETIPEQLI